MGRSLILAAFGMIGLSTTGCGKASLPVTRDTGVGPGDSVPDLHVTPDFSQWDPDLGQPDSAPDAPAVPDAGPDLGQPDSAPDATASPDVRGDGASSSPTLYAMTARLTATDGGHPAPEPPLTHSFSILVDWEANTATAGANGTANRVAIRQIGDNEWESAGPLEFYLGPKPNDSVTYSSLRLTRGQDGCTATASGEYLKPSGSDVSYWGGFKAALTGVPDRAGPQCTVFPSGNVHPLSFDRILVDELLPGGTTGTLVGPGASLPLVPSPSGSAFGVSGFSLPGKALAFGTTYTLRLLPDAVDLGGNRTATPPTLTTLADPGLLAQDGFEGPAQAFLSFTAALTTAAALPIPAGNKAIAIPPSGTAASPCQASFMARLAVPTGAAQVKLAIIDYRPKSWPDPSGGRPYTFRVAVPNGAVVSTYSLETTPLPIPWSGDPPGSDLYTYGELLEARLPLPTGTGQEVLFHIERHCPQPYPPAQPGLIVDSLRVE
jgi:hypothetical protein